MTLLKLLLSPTGTLNRKDFWIGFVLLALFVWGMDSYLGAHTGTMLSFWISLIYVPLVVYIIYCIYGKRLRLMGHSLWPITGVVFLEICIMMGVMFAFGGADYFAAFAEYDRKAVIDESVRLQLITDYQAQISANLHIIRPLLLIVPVAFTLWVGLSAKTGAAFGK